MKKFLPLALMALVLAGCAELNMNFDPRKNCGERGVTRVRNTPSGYPCVCCPYGE